MQFSNRGIGPKQKNLICALVAAVNASQALHYCVRGKALPPELLTEFVEGTWENMNRRDVLVKGVNLLHTLPALTLALARPYLVLDQVKGMEVSNSEWLHDHPDEIITKPAAIRAVVVQSHFGQLHNLVSLGVDEDEYTLLFLDSYDVTQIRKLKLVSRLKRLWLAKEPGDPPLGGPAGTPAPPNHLYEIVGVYGVDVIETPPETVH